MLLGLFTSPQPPQNDSSYFIVQSIVFSLAPASKLSLWLHFENLQYYSHALVHNGISLLTPFLFPTVQQTERNGIEISFLIDINHAPVLVRLVSESY